MTDTEIIRQVINVIKSFAVTATYTDAADLAKQQFIANPSTHIDWDGLSEGYKAMNIKLAEAAIYELSTGKEIE